MTTLSITAGPYTFRARLEEERAPRTCEAFSKLLPFQQEVIYAGNHFLTLSEGNEHLRPLGQIPLWQGARDIVFAAE